MEAQQTEIIRIPRTLTATQRQILANNVISFIIRRTQRGLDKFDRPFTGYSESYKNDPRYNKSGRVNLRLTFDMLANIRLLNHGTGFITIGFERGSVANDKAAWHKQGINKPVRDFLGISRKELNRMLSQITTFSQLEVGGIVGASERDREDSETSN